MFKSKNKPNIIVYFLYILILFIIFDIVRSYTYTFLGRSIIYGKYTVEIILESICVICALVAMLLAGNSYIFTQKKVGFFKSLMIGGVMLFYSLYVALSYSSYAFSSNIYDFMSLVIYCTTIGLFEEFMCRGWVQNEFIERNGSTKKQIITSIFLSSLIFGGMHISNLWNTSQGLISTISQIIQATSLGCFLGSVYYRTKNIWAVAFLHGFWDFALMLSELPVIKDCTYSTPTPPIIINELISSLCIASIFFIISLYLLRNINDEIPSQISVNSQIGESTIMSLPQKKTKITLKRTIFTCIFLYIAVIINNIIFSTDNDTYKTCYTYDTKELTNYTITEFYKDEYIISLEKETVIDFEPITNNNLGEQDETSIMYDESSPDNTTTILTKYNFKIGYEDEKIYLENTETEDKIYLDYTDIYDYYVVNNLIVIATNDDTIYYSDYINLDNVSNKKSYLDDLKESFIMINSVPTISDLGYLESEDGNYIYINSNIYDLIIDGEKIYLIN